MPIDQIQFEDVSVFFGSTPALRKLSVTLQPGLTMLRGANGSGKSTVLRLLERSIRPTRGRIRFLHQQSAVNPPNASVLGHEAGLYPDLTARENLALFATYWGAPESRVESGIERFALAPFADRPVRGLSQGQRQRTAIARAALADTPLVLLDEPTTGLDVDSRDTLFSFAAEKRSAGAFVLWISHEALPNLEPDHLLELRAGRLVTESDEA